MPPIAVGGDEGIVVALVRAVLVEVERLAAGGKWKIG